MADPDRDELIKVEEGNFLDSERIDENSSQGQQNLKSQESSPQWINKVGPIRASRLEDSKSSNENDTNKEKSSPIQHFRPLHQKKGPTDSSNIHTEFKRIFNNYAKEATPLSKLASTNQSAALKQVRKPPVQTASLKSQPSASLFQNSSLSNINQRKDNLRGRLFSGAKEPSCLAYAPKTFKTQKLVTPSSTKYCSAVQKKPNNHFVSTHSKFSSTHYLRKTPKRESETGPESVFRLSEKDKQMSEYSMMKPVYDKSKQTPKASTVVDNIKTESQSIVASLRPLSPSAVNFTSAGRRQAKQLTFNQTMKALEVRRPYSPQGIRLRTSIMPASTVALPAKHSHLSEFSKHRVAGVRQRYQSPKDLSAANRVRFTSFDGQRTTPLNSEQALKNSPLPKSKAFDTLKELGSSLKNTQESSIMDKLLSEYEEQHKKHCLKVNLNKRLHESTTAGRSISNQKLKSPPKETKESSSSSEGSEEDSSDDDEQ